jgi:hypothetical protein
MASLRPISIPFRTFEEALRDFLAAGTPPSETPPPKAHQKRQPSTRKAKATKAKKKRKK